jgi:hypothetical protein
MSCDLIGRRAGRVGAFAPLAWCLSLGAAATAVAQPGPDFGLDFVTVGAAGNREATDAERNNADRQSSLNYGSVGHEFRITRTEATGDHWFEFVLAYAPFHTGDPGSFQFTGNSVSYLGNGQYIGGGQGPTTAGWHYVARYVNWLHNGKVNQAWAFESGAYDTSTFTVNPDGTRNDQIAHSPGARFWIPTFEETYKAFFYDPNRYGPGQEGYWMYPNGSNIAPVSGPPGEGTTNTGTVGTHGPGQWYHAVGSYPNVQTPWGLLDASGGVREWTETGESVPNPYANRISVGSSFTGFVDHVQSYDAADAFYFEHDPRANYGFRVAGVIPTPMTVCVLTLVPIVSTRRRR